MAVIWGQFALIEIFNSLVIIAIRWVDSSGVLILIVSEEISPAFIAARTFDQVDLSADLLGICQSTLLALMISRKPA